MCAVIDAEAPVDASEKESMEVKERLKRDFPGNKSVTLYFSDSENKEALVSAAKALRTACVAKRDAIAKCLAILLDPDVMDFAVYKSSLVRIAANRKVHKRFQLNMIVAEALNHAAEVVIKEDNPVKVDEESLRKIGSQSTKLVSILHREVLRNGPNIDFIPEYSLEPALKSHYDKEASKLMNKSDQEVNLTDFVILMKWFDTKNS